MRCFSGSMSAVIRMLARPRIAVVGGVLAALILADRGDAIGVVAVRAQARRVVDRQPEVVAQLRTGKPLGTILVIDRRPLAGEIDFLCEGGGGT